MGFPIDIVKDNPTANATANPTANPTADPKGNATGNSPGRARSESMSPAQWIAAAGGLGLAPIAPGTFGSVGGAVLFLGVMWIGEGNFVALTGLYLSLTAVLFGLGVWASSRAEREWAHHDDNRIVIDEVVGQLIALAPLVWFFGLRPVSLPNSLSNSLSSSLPSSLFSSLFLPVVTAFVLFRLFDVWKPGAIRWAEHRFESGLGVMADDVVAGVYSAIVLSLVWAPVLEKAPKWTQWSAALTDIGIRSFGFGTGALA